LKRPLIIYMALLFGYQAAVTVTPSLYPDLPYKPDSATDSLPQFIELLRREPGRIPVATSGNGSGGHLFLEMLTGETGTRVHAGLMQVAATPAELAATVTQEIAIYSKIIHSRNIKLQ
jgi:tripartite-type tricarboxylate transporter receptor subunit TctC